MNKDVYFIGQVVLNGSIALLKNIYSILNIATKISIFTIYPLFIFIYMLIKYSKPDRYDVSDCDSIIAAVLFLLSIAIHCYICVIYLYYLGNIDPIATFIENYFWIIIVSEPILVLMVVGIIDMCAE